MNRLFPRTALLTLALTTLGFAQMGRGMGSGPGSGTMGPGGTSTTGVNPGQGMGSGMGMSGAMGSREMMDGPTVGPDGPVYVVRQSSAATSNQGIVSPNSSASKYELVALSARDGSANWKLEITGTMVSEPTLGKDGRIFMTASDFAMNGTSQSGGGMMNPGTTITPLKSRLIIVTAGPTAAQITKSVEVDSDVLSAPKAATDESGNYVIYVTGFEMGIDDKDAIASGQKHLYAFTPDGSIKFSVKISQP